MYRILYIILLCIIIPTTQGAAQSLTINADKLEVCGETDSVTFSYTYKGLVEPLICSWEFGNGTTSGSCDSVTIAFSNMLAPEVLVSNLTVTDANNTQIQESINTTFYPEPGTYITFETYPAICDQDNGSVIFNDTINYFYDWSFLPGNDNPGNQYNLATGSYQVTITAKGGSNCVDVFEITILSESFFSPTLTIDTQTPADCNQNGCYDMSIGGGGSYETKIIEGNNTITFTTNPFTWCPAITSSQNYPMTITDLATGCIWEETIVFDPPLPPPSDITINNLPEAICEGDQVLLDYEIFPEGSFYAELRDGSQIIDPNTPVSAGSYCIYSYDIATGCLSNQVCFDIEEIIIDVQLEYTTPDFSCLDYTGEIGISVSGGSGNYTYLWSNNANSPNVLSNLNAGYYWVTVVDTENGCEGTLDSILVEDGRLSATVDLISAPDCLQEFGTLEATASGGVPPYNYVWSDATNSMSPTLNLVTAGTYTVTITDDSGCTITSESLIPVFENTLDISIISEDPDPCNNDYTDYIIDATISGGVPTYTYSWLDDMNNEISTTEDLTGLTNGTYTLIVTDADGCQADTTVTLAFEEIDFPTPFAITNGVLCPGEGTTLSISGDYDLYMWNDNSTDSTLTVVMPGLYTCTVVSGNGICSAIVEFPEIVAAENCIWPGDANYDGVANNHDILSIGVAYGNTGQARTDQSIDWVGHPVDFEWDSVFIDGINQMHADCNGNGIVDMNDTVAVALNYQLPAHQLRNSQTDGDYHLEMDFTETSSVYNDYVEIKVKIGEPDNAVSSLYGIAFSIAFNYPEVIKESSITVDYSNSVFGDKAELLRLTKPLLNPEYGRIDFAISRFDHISLTDITGEILTVRFIIEDNIDGFAPQDVNYILEAWFEDILCIEAQGNGISLTPNEDALEMIAYSNTDNISTLPEGFSFYPNPIKGTLNIDWPADNSILSVRVIDILGREISQIEQGTTSINTSEWKNGIYFLEILDDTENRYVVKVLK